MTHAVVGAAAAAAVLPWRRPMFLRGLGLAAVCSMLPDLDVGLMAWGVPYDSFFGHRGFFHSPAFALLLCVILVSWVFQRQVNCLSRGWWALVAFFTLVTSSHGVLDGLTNGGEGVAFLSPISNRRIFLPWQPMEVSAIGLVGFVKYGGWETLKSEFRWVWLPTGLLCTIVIPARWWIMNRRAGPPSP